VFSVGTAVYSAGWLYTNYITAYLPICCDLAFQPEYSSQFSYQQHVGVAKHALQQG